MNYVDEIRSILLGRRFSPDENGLFWFGGLSKQLNGPWVFTGDTSRMDCLFLHSFLFDHVYGQTHVPARCQQCWKIVVAPKTLDELHFILRLQRNLGWLAKCGCEGDRVNTPRLYGGYWYCGSMEEGREKKSVIAGKIGGIPIKLKRACTEFEQACGPSNRWVVEPWQLEYEEAASSLFRRDPAHDALQTKVDAASATENWNLRAFQWGDKSYLNFTRGKAPFPDVIEY